MTRKAKEKRDWTKLRLYAVLAFLLLASVAVLGRAVQLQIIQHERLSNLARQEYQKTITLVPSRGLIKDRHGAHLAASVQVDSVYARPGQIENPAKAAKPLAAALGLSVGSVRRALSSSQPFVWLRRQVEPEAAARVRKLNLAGVGVLPESRRYYPQVELAAHLIGFAGLDAQGLEGLEKRYDKLLKGSTSRVVRMQDAKGRPIYDGRRRGGRISDGHDLTLTIDSGIQFLTEQALARAVADSGARGGMAVVVAVKTGEVLASAVLPTFNPNIYSRYPKETWRNRVVTDPFEPGSVMKVFTLAAALEEGLFDLDSVINCEGGAARFGGRTVRDVHPYQELTLAEVLKYSSNIGAAKIGLALGPERLRGNLSRFGFGRRTGVDLPGESAGLLRPAQAWRIIDTANIAFGQGVAVTALQLVSAVAAVANDGLMMRPHVVKEIRDAVGLMVRRIEPRPVGQIMSRRTARLVRRMMESVVADGGTGTRARPPGYRVAGKTGTAQKLDKATGTYSKSAYLALFVGYAPAVRPEVAVLVVIDEPRTSIYGGKVAAPAFAEIVHGALPLLGVQPSERGWLKAEAAGSNRVVKPAPAPKRAVASTKAAKAGRPKAMPALVGLSLRQALKVVSALGLKPVVTGSGYVVEQDPAPGQALRGVRTCRLKLEAGA